MEEAAGEGDVVRCRTEEGGDGPPEGVDHHFSEFGLPLSEFLIRHGFEGSVATGLAAAVTVAVGMSG